LLEYQSLLSDSFVCAMSFRRFRILVSCAESTARTTRRRSSPIQPQRFFTLAWEEQSLDLEADQQDDEQWCDDDGDAQGEEELAPSMEDAAPIVEEHGPVSQDVQDQTQSEESGPDAAEEDHPEPQEIQSEREEGSALLPFHSSDHKRTVTCSELRSDPKGKQPLRSNNIVRPYRPSSLISISWKIMIMAPHR
jgi:hypothetical protein